LHRVNLNDPFGGQNERFNETGRWVGGKRLKVKEGAFGRWRLEAGELKAQSMKAPKIK